MNKIGSKKVALIIGSSGGIGTACALSLAHSGYEVALHYNKNRHHLSDLQARIVKEGRQAILVKADVSNPNSVSKMADTVIKTWGRIDTLLISSGISEIKKFEELSVKDWDRMMDVNLKGPFLCCQKVLPHMKHRRSGRIILISSQAGHTGGIFVGAHYSIAKAGITCLMKYLSNKFAKSGILINCVAPGLVATEMLKEFPTELINNSIKSIPLNRIAHPNEIAEAVSFLASPGSSYITGMTLHVNGGLYNP